ncbi:hypothetical protein BgAZ_109200 [Babesia gibsoni]|uniref:Uncharacterized protein n=1 Tax=Babesia gibsoni TaxID=33632 RepID=A0AAD8PGN6_BABGI|nr:hypothetical protein BgAZ_109200 [Babesia gibsoni]
MVPFSYLKRVTDVNVLRRLLCLEEQAAPQTIKVVAANALKGITASSYRNVNKEGCSSLQLASLIQKKIRQSDAKEWSPSAIISVVHYLSEARAPLAEDIRSLLLEKTLNASGLNLLDLSQLLSAGKRLNITLPLEYFKEYVSDNIHGLLVTGSCKNAYSLLNAFSSHGIALDPKTLLYIEKHFHRDYSTVESFIDMSNFCNSLSLQVNLAYRSGHCSRDKAYNELLNALKLLIDRCITEVESGNVDLEAAVDVLDSLVLWSISKGDDVEGAVMCSRVYKLLDVVHDMLKVDNGMSTYGYGDNMSNRSSSCSHIQPRVLRIVLRNMVVTGVEHPELLKRMMQIYCTDASKWSHGGIADILRSVAYFGYRGTEVGHLVEYLSSHCCNGYFKHVNANTTFIDACLVAANSDSEPHFIKCKQLLCKFLENMDSISTSNIALGLLILRICCPNYEMLSLLQLEKVVFRLNGSKVALQVHTEAYATSSQTLRVSTGVYRDHFTNYCKIRLN